MAEARSGWPLPQPIPGLCWGRFARGLKDFWEAGPRFPPLRIGDSRSAAKRFPTGTAVGADLSCPRHWSP
eukprot:9466129-Pyramimonas_sp.AAC.1